MTYCKGPASRAAVAPSTTFAITLPSHVGQLSLRLSEPPSLFSINPQNQRGLCQFIALVRQIIDKNMNVMGWREMQEQNKVT